MIRLLTKQEIDVQKAREKKQEIDEGVKLAKSIDQLRELKSTEQANLTKFRDASLDQVRKEIDKEIEERDSLRRENELLKEERIKLTAPIDLTQAWNEVKNSKREVTEWKKEMLDRETLIISREASVEAIQSTFFGREETIREKENLTERYLFEANKRYEIAEKTKLETDAIKKDTEKESREVKSFLKGQQENLSVRERNIALEREQIDKEKEEIRTEKLHIQSQQETLKRTWDAIRQKNG